MTFRVGQKVVCVDDDFEDRWFDSPSGYEVEGVFPVKGQVYTIRGIIDGCLLLSEIINPPGIFDDGMGEIRFYAKRFRPVVERKTDISIFTSLLNTTKTPELV